MLNWKHFLTSKGAVRNGIYYRGRKQGWRWKSPGRSSVRAPVGFGAKPPEAGDKIICICGHHMKKYEANKFHFITASPLVNGKIYIRRRGGRAPMSPLATPLQWRLDWLSTLGLPSSSPSSSSSSAAAAACIETLCNKTGTDCWLGLSGWGCEVGVAQRCREAWSHHSMSLSHCSFISLRRRSRYASRCCLVSCCVTDLASVITGSGRQLQPVLHAHVISLQQSAGVCVLHRRAVCDCD